MISAEELILDCMKHRGCGIRAASYEIAPHTWSPEACLWLPTESGLRRMWIHSFAHCLGAEQLTFNSKLKADQWALVAGRAIVDRALDDAEEKSTPNLDEIDKRKTSVWQNARRSISGLGYFKIFRQF